MPGFSATPSADPVRDLKDWAPSYRGLEFSAVQARTIAHGGQSWLFSADEQGVRHIALGVLVRGRARCALGVTTSSSVPAPNALWQGLHAFVRRQDVTELWIESISAWGSRGTIPTWAHEHNRFGGIKLYILDLRLDRSLNSLTTNHRRNILKAQRNAVELVELDTPAAIAAHTRVANASLSRRKERGEPVGDRPWSEGGIAGHLATMSGKAKLYQASLAGRVVSSNLVLALGDCAYFITGGSSEEGMRVGASHYLMHRIIGTLGAAGVTTLNLDIAAGRTGGLDRFKEGFGAEIFCYERAYFDVANPFKLVRNFVLHRGRAAPAPH